VNPVHLGVNVDHVATLRQARKTTYPDPVAAAAICELAGADQITLHLREDRRHIQERDLVVLRRTVQVRLNLEMAATPDMVKVAYDVKPDMATLVPERREELTTEGGLDVAGLHERIAPLTARLQQARIRVSLFIEPEPHQVTAAARLGADFIELHTGKYALLADADLARAAAAADPKNAQGDAPAPAAGRAARVANGPALYPSGETHVELEKLRAAVKLGRSLKLKVNVGHGLNYRNVGPVAALAGLSWAHIGHAIVARSIMVGMARAVREMSALLDRRGPHRP
jgi:pyridoxine 5-phosphate synthase